MLFSAYLTHTHAHTHTHSLSHTHSLTHTPCLSTATNSLFSAPTRSRSTHVLLVFATRVKCRVLQFCWIGTDARDECKAAPRHPSSLPATSFDHFEWSPLSFFRRCQLNRGVVVNMVKRLATCCLSRVSEQARCGR